MDSPYLESGESIVLTTDRVSINSEQYDLLLTTRYLILVNIRYAQVQPQKIPLLAILSVKGGKIATGDLVITLFFSDTSRTGRSEQMNLIFSRNPGEQRTRERDEWIKQLMELIVSVRQELTGSGATATDQGIGLRPATRRTVAPEMQLPHTTAINVNSAPIELNILPDESEFTAFPERARESEARHAEPSVDEIPANSGEEAVSQETIPPLVPEIITSPASQEEPAESLNISDAITPEEAPPVSSTVPASQDTVPPSVPEIITSPASQEEPAESLNISDATKPEEAPPVSSTVPASQDTVPPSVPEIITSPASQEEPAESLNISDAITPEEAPPVPSTVTALSDLSSPAQPIDDHPTDRNEEAVPADTIPPEGRDPAGSVRQPGADSTPLTPGSPPLPADLGGRRKSFIIVTAIIFLILGIAGVAMVYPEYFSVPGKELLPVPTPAITETPVPVTPTLMPPGPTQVIIPATGVWVRVVYPRNYYGRLGNPGSLREVNGSGDRLYKMIENIRLVQVQMYKTDNSGDVLTVEIYRDGEVITHRSISSPMGFIELLIDAKTGNPPGITPVITQSANQTTTQAGNPAAIPPANLTRQVSNLTVTPAGNQSIQVRNQTMNQTGSSGDRVLYF